MSEQRECRHVATASRQARCGGRRGGVWLWVVWLLVLLLSACGGQNVRTQAPDTQRPRVAAIDWGQAQTLTAMGMPPVAAAQVESYNTWVGAPKLPESVRDVGLRAQPNLELLAQIDPDLITITPMYAGLKPLLSRIAPVKVIGIYFDDQPVWQATLEATRALGRAVGRPEAAEQLIRQTKARIQKLEQQLPEDVPPLLVVQFQDARHVRVYAEGSLIDATLQRLGLRNAWDGPSTTWGTALVPLARLASIEHARMVIIKPFPVGVADTLAHNVIWQHLPAVTGQPVLTLDAVWSYGGLPSATRFAELLVAALTHTQADAASANRASAR